MVADVDLRAARQDGVRDALGLRADDRAARRALADRSRAGSSPRAPGTSRTRPGRSLESLRVFARDGERDHAPRAARRRPGATSRWASRRVTCRARANARASRGREGRSARRTIGHVRERRRHRPRRADASGGAARRRRPAGRSGVARPSVGQRPPTRGSALGARRRPAPRRASGSTLVRDRRPRATASAGSGDDGLIATRAPARTGCSSAGLDRDLRLRLPATGCRSSAPARTQARARLRLGLGRARPTGSASRSSALSAARHVEPACRRGYSSAIATKSSSSTIVSSPGAGETPAGDRPLGAASRRASRARRSRSAPRREPRARDSPFESCSSGRGGGSETCGT